jgi:hypothetical protein
VVQAGKPVTAESAKNAARDLLQIRYLVAALLIQQNTPELILHRLKLSLLTTLKALYSVSMTAN